MFCASSPSHHHSFPASLLKLRRLSLLTTTTTSFQNHRSSTIPTLNFLFIVSPLCFALFCYVGTISVFHLFSSVATFIDSDHGGAEPESLSIFPPDKLGLSPMKTSSLSESLFFHVATLFELRVSRPMATHILRRLSPELPVRPMMFITRSTFLVDGGCGIICQNPNVTSFALMGLSGPNCYKYSWAIRVVIKLGHKSELKESRSPDVTECLMFTSLEFVTRHWYEFWPLVFEISTSKQMTSTTCEHGPPKTYFTPAEHTFCSGYWPEATSFKTQHLITNITDESHDLKSSTQLAIHVDSIQASLHSNGYSACILLRHQRYVLVGLMGFLYCFGTDFGIKNFMDLGFKLNSPIRPIILVGVLFRPYLSSRFWSIGLDTMLAGMVAPIDFGMKNFMDVCSKVNSPIRPILLVGVLFRLYISSKVWTIVLDIMLAEMGTPIDLIPVDRWMKLRCQFVVNFSQECSVTSLSDDFSRVRESSLVLRLMHKVVNPGRFPTVRRFISWLESHKLLQAVHSRTIDLDSLLSLIFDSLRSLMHVSHRESCSEVFDFPPFSLSIIVLSCHVLYYLSSTVLDLFIVIATYTI